MKNRRNQIIMKLMLLAICTSMLTACEKSEKELYETCAAGLVYIEHSYYYEISIDRGGYINEYFEFCPITDRTYDDRNMAKKGITYGTGGIYQKMASF